MKKNVFLFLMVILVCQVNGMEQKDISNENYNANTSKSNKKEILKPHDIGDVPIILPSPGEEFAEVTQYKHLQVLELTVPTQNRLICGFLKTNEFSLLTTKQDSNQSKLSRYALIEVGRGDEYTDISEQEFQDGVKEVKSSLGKIFSSSMPEAEEEFNRRMKSLDLDNVQFGKPVELGTLFSKKDAYCSGMIMSINQGKESTKIAADCILMRVKRRVIFIYLYDHYKGKETVDWLRVTGEKWADVILRANE